MTNINDGSIDEVERFMDETGMALADNVRHPLRGVGHIENIEWDPDVWPDGEWTIKVVFPGGEWKWCYISDVRLGTREEVTD